MVEIVEFVVQKYYKNSHLYVISGKFWHLRKRKIYYLKLWYCLNVDISEFCNLLTNSDERIEENIFILDDEIVFKNKKDAEKMLDYINSFYILNKLTE